MFPYLEDDSDPIFGTTSHYRGPMGGSASFVDGSVSVFDGRGGFKLAGADGEEDKKRQTADEEPRSLLSATTEQLEKMIKGTGEAVTKGQEGAKEAISRTWGELTGNEELHKGVEFGVKATAEVSKDVFKEAGADAAKAYLGDLWKTRGGGPKEPKMTDGLPQTVLVPNRILKYYDEFPDWGKNLGRRLEDIRDEVYNR